MKLEWLPEAARNLQSQLAYIAERSPSAAIAIGDSIEASVARLADYPRAGRPGRVPDTRELAVPGTPYVVIYRVEASNVVILRLLHGAQYWPPEPAG